MTQPPKFARTVPANVFDGFVDDAGIFVLDNQHAFRRYVAAKFKGHEVTVTVQKKAYKRSLDQNAYWWAVPVKILADELGYTENQMHYALLGEYGGYQIGPTGQPVPKIASSSELSRAEFTKLIEWVLDWAPTELHIVIPPPDPEWRQRHAREAVAS
jgi:hypothetical protein